MCECCSCLVLRASGLYFFLTRDWLAHRVRVDNVDYDDGMLLLLALDFLCSYVMGHKGRDVLLGRSAKVMLDAAGRCGLYCGDDGEWSDSVSGDWSFDFDSLLERRWGAVGRRKIRR